MVFVTETVADYAQEMYNMAVEVANGDETLVAKTGLTDALSAVVNAYAEIEAALQYEMADTNSVYESAKEVANKSEEKAYQDLVDEVIQMRNNVEVVLADATANVTSA